MAKEPTELDAVAATALRVAATEVPAEQASQGGEVRQQPG